jgi:hypothetical protein
MKIARLMRLICLSCVGLVATGCGGSEPGIRNNSGSSGKGETAQQSTPSTYKLAVRHTDGLTQLHPSGQIQSRAVMARIVGIDSDTITIETDQLAVYVPADQAVNIETDAPSLFVVDQQASGGWAPLQVAQGVDRIELASQGTSCGAYPQDAPNGPYTFPRTCQDNYRIAVLPISSPPVVGQTYDVQLTISWRSK